MKKLTLLLAVLLLTGCVTSATMLQSPHSNYGPVDGSGIGKIRYDGGGAMGDQEDAYKQMYEACNGKYKILDQQIQSKVEGNSVRYDPERQTKQSTISTIDYVYITFKCE